MSCIEAGLEVYSTEVDDRGIDQRVRYAPGRCMEIQVKAVYESTLTHVENPPGQAELFGARHANTGRCVDYRAV